MSDKANETVDTIMLSLNINRRSPYESAAKPKKGSPYYINLSKQQYKSFFNMDDAFQRKHISTKVDLMSKSKLLFL